MKAKMTKLFAVAIVALVAMVSSAVVLVEQPADAAAPYEIEMYVGDTFTYTPTTNLTSTITPTGTACTTAYTGGSATGFLTMDSGTISGTPTAAGQFALNMSAVWAEGSMTQTATQTVNITVHNHTVFTTGASTVAIIGNAWTHAPTATGSGAVTLSDPVIPAGISGWCSWDSENNRFTGTPASGSAGTYTLQITATAADSSEAKTQSITLSVFTDLAITSPTSIQTYVGQTVSYDITTNMDGTAGAIISKTAALTSVSSKSTLALSSGTISGSFTSAANTSVSPWYTDYTVVLGASGTLNGMELSDVTSNLTIRVFTTLAFTTAPTPSNISAGSATNDPLSVVIASEIEGATSIVYNWGDGTRTVITPSSSEAATYSTAHTYSEDGSYVVTITASNANGASSTYILYDTTESGNWSITSAADAVGDIFAQHGFLFLLLGVAGIICLAVFMLGVRNYYLLLIGAVLIIAAMAVYLLEITPIADMLSFGADDAGGDRGS